MNIFFLHSNVYECARAHCDKHVVKMILETAQLLSTAHHVLDGDQAMEGIYKSTHANHPCAIWVRESDMNYHWAFALLGALCREYTHRYGKRHKVEDLLIKLSCTPKNIQHEAFSAPPQCMPDEYKTSGNRFLSVVEAYRNYYIGAKAPIAKWTRRNPPAWWPTN